MPSWLATTVVDVNAFEESDKWGFDKKFENTFGKIETVSDGFSDMVSSYTAYQFHVTDHLCMLNSVYNLEEQAHKYSLAMDEYGVQAHSASKIYDKYSKELIHTLLYSVRDTIFENIADEIKDLAIDKITELLNAKFNSYFIEIEETLIKKIFPKFTTTAENFEILPYHYSVTTTALADYRMSRIIIDDKSTGERINDARLQLLLYLTSSKYCYKAIQNSAQAYNYQSYSDICQQRINEIDELLADLYLAIFSIDCDSYENIDDVINNNIKVINNIELSEPINNFEKIFFGAMAKAINSVDKVYNYKVCDADHDGCYEMALTATIENQGQGTKFLFESIKSPSIRYSLPPASGAAWGGFIYDASNDRLMYYDGKSTVGQTYSIYSIYEDGSWNVVSEYIREFKDDYIEPKITSCYWNGVDISEDEFRIQEDILMSSEWIDSNEILNMNFDLSAQQLSDELYKFLSAYSNPKNPINYTSSDGKEISIISVDNIFDTYINDVDYFNNTPGFVTDSKEIVDCLSKIKTTCFIIDETENGTRIRFDSFPEEIEFSVDGQNLIGTKNGISFYMNCYSENNNIDNQILTFYESINGITSGVIGDLSRIKLDLIAKTTAKDGLILREGPSTKTNQLTIIPYDSAVTILSVSDDYQSGEWEQKMVQVDYNGQIGYVHTNYLLIDTQIDINKYTKDQQFAICMLWYNMYYWLYQEFTMKAGLFDYETTNEYSSDYVKILPKGITINAIINDFKMYFSKKIVSKGLVENHCLEKDGYLWLLTGYGGPSITNRIEVVDLLEISETEIQCNIVRYYDEQFYDMYGEQTEEIFRLIYEDGRWKCDEIVRKL
ncbi:MAG: SH3 domain-containing protein [Oscillospiraceae bacterium]|nr:SH3 domain-containing protein [Oscillospiraceae bacterium]